MYSLPVLKLYSIAIFLSALLLFMVQPLAAKLILPLLGGSPQVWNTCMVFFQGALLAGYAYSYALSRFIPLRAQAFVHVVVLALGAITLPIALPPIDSLPAGDLPILWLVRLLAVMVGAPFFALSTLGPLLQHWFAGVRHERSGDPYFLYVASNAGSAAGLLGYPIVLERFLHLGEQGFAWTIGYAALTVLVLACAAALARAQVATPATPAPTPKPIAWSRRLRWTLWAMIPSSLLLGATQKITLDVAAIPLLWVLPLLVYLVSMMLAFSARVTTNAARLGEILPWAGVVLCFTLLGPGVISLPLLILVHLGFLLLGAWMCHRRLAEDRPAPSQLTEFYLWMAVGGVLGGVFNALVAPVVFNVLAEYPIMLGLVMLARPQATTLLRSVRGWGLAAASGVAMVALLLGVERAIASMGPGVPAVATVSLRALVPSLAMGVLFTRSGALRGTAAMWAVAGASIYLGAGGTVLLRARTYFGVHQVVELPGGKWHRLVHGSTNHGVQATFEPLRFVPTSYFHPTGPLGAVFRTLYDRNRPITIGGIGLGAGSIAAYVRPGDALTFYEIDPAVARIASNPRYFTYLTDCQGSVKVVLGDGRLTLGAEPEGKFDLIVLDAFTSDAVPVHIITRDAFKDVYLPRLKPDGLIALNISNRHLLMRPVLGAIAHSLGLVAYVKYDVATKEEREAGKQASGWVVLAREGVDLGTISPRNGWIRADDNATGPVWTDDFSNVLGAMVWGKGQEVPR